MNTSAHRFTGLAGLLAVASLSFWAAACGGGSNTQGSGGAGTSSGGATATGGASSGGNSGSTGGSGSGGVTSSGGAATGGATGSGGAATGGATGSGGAATGGATGSGGKNSDGGATSTGGATGGGGKAGGGGNANAGGTTGGGGAGGKASSGGMTGGGGTTGGGGAGALTLTSPGWMNMAGCASNMAASCATLPKELTRTGGGVGTSPELNWTGVPAGTKSFAVVLQDISGNSTHWVIWNIPGTAATLAANVDGSTATPAVPAGSQQCSKDPAAGAEGYYGPGACGNVYEFTLYALSVAPFSPTMATDEKQVRTQLLALGNSILGTATLRGRTFAPNCP